MKLAEVISILRKLAPEALAEPWDKVGLQVGRVGRPVQRALLCIDLTEAVLAEAIRVKAQLIVAYHPPIFEPLAALTGGDWKQRVVMECAERKIAVYSPHTALDAAVGGVNDWLCEGIGKGRREPIAASASSAEGRSGRSKIVCFVPEAHADRLREAMSKAGAGRIGNYVECSFESRGHGTFRGLAGADPFVGRPGRRERVDELRLEMVCEDSVLGDVIAALGAAHPYEEPAFDVYGLKEPPEVERGLPGQAVQAGQEAGQVGQEVGQVGQGRFVVLDRPISVSTLKQRIKRHLGVKHLAMGVPRGVSGSSEKAGRISRVGVCAGAGASVLTGSGIGFDAILTGEMRHHDVLAAVARGTVVVLAGHTQTERPYLRVYRDRLSKLTGRKVAWTVSKADRAPLELG